MTALNTNLSSFNRTPNPSSDSDAKLKFSSNNDFQHELRRRVESFLKSTGRRQRDCPQMYAKTAIQFVALIASYVALVFFAHHWWLAFPFATLLGLSVAAIAFNVQHDGGHGGYSNYPWINKLAAMTLDLLGGSSYLWRYKHGVFHHTYVNITGHDTDIDLGALGRLSPHQKRYWFHRYQHVYLWPLYGLIAVKWHLIDDFKDVVAGDIGGHRVPRPKGWDLVLFIGGKLTFFSFAFGIPWLFHPFWQVALFYGVTALVIGIVLATVFQLAHCVEEAEFPMPRPESGRMENAWAVHQTETTVDFSRSSKITAWLLGGLNFQVVHHLFPRICHVNYPELAKIVEQTCNEKGVRYSSHKTFWTGLASHYRWLKRMGREDHAYGSAPLVEHAAPEHDSETAAASL